MSKTIAPLVSVIIPTYNHGHFLGRALQSVLDQTYDKWEAIVIDNHSTDNTDEVLRKFTDERIRALKIHNNGVIAASRNMGIQAAHGEWIAFLDSDDWWKPQKLQVCLDRVKTSVDLVYHSLEIINDISDNKNIRVNGSRQLKKPVIIDLLLNGNTISNSSVMVRKKVLEKIGKINENIDMVGAEDYNTWLRIAKNTDGFLMVNKPLGCYYLHENNYSLKDLSKAKAIATQSYILLLSEKKRKRSVSVDEYLKGKRAYLGLEYNTALRYLCFSALNAKLELQLKSIYMIVMCYLKLLTHSRPRD